MFWSTFAQVALTLLAVAVVCVALEYRELPQNSIMIGLIAVATVGASVLGLVCVALIVAGKEGVR